MTTRSDVEKQAAMASLMFKVNMDYGHLSDSNIRAVIAQLRGIILKRQQERATKRYQKHTRDSSQPLET